MQHLADGVGTGCDDGEAVADSAEKDGCQREGQRGATQGGGEPVVALFTAQPVVQGVGKGAVHQQLGKQGGGHVDHVERGAGQADDECDDQEGDGQLVGVANIANVAQIKAR